MGENGQRPTNKRQFGKQLESEACDFLLQQGLTLITKNYNCKMGEIDLIMRDRDDYLVFVEVRYRKSSKYGNGAESISRFKRCKIINHNGRRTTPRSRRKLLRCGDSREIRTRRPLSGYLDRLFSS